MRYLVLLRGINVGGKNKISMAELKLCLEELGYADVATYINSGNVLLSSSKSPKEITQEIEAVLPRTFALDSSLIKILVLSDKQLQAVIQSAPKGFGSQPDKYHSDVAFLIDVPSDEAMQQVEVNPAVDAAWQGNGVVYYQRLSAQRTKSRLSKIAGKPVYKSMTIRTWNTVQKLHERMLNSS